MEPRRYPLACGVLFWVIRPFRGRYRFANVPVLPRAPGHGAQGLAIFGV